MKSNDFKKNVSFTKLLYSLIFAFFVFVQGIRLSNIDTVFVDETFFTKEMLLGYLTIFLTVPFLIVFFLFLPVLFVIEIQVMFDMKLKVKTIYQTCKEIVIEYIKPNIKQSSLGVYRC